MTLTRFLRTTLAAMGISLISACGGADQHAPSILEQPADVSVAEGGSASFTVLAAGDDPLSYAWLNGADSLAIAGESLATLVRDAVSLVVNGQTVKVRVTNPAGEVVSRTATLTVTERAWSAGVEVVADTARNVATVVDSNGHTHLLSVIGDAAQAEVRAHVKLASANSTLPNPLAAVTVLQASEPLTQPTTSLSLAANGVGHVVAVWHRNGIARAALYTPAGSPATAGTWRLLATQVSGLNSSNASDPAVAAVGNTGFEFVWREQVGSNEQRDVVARRYTIAGDNLDSQIVSIESSSEEPQSPRLVVDAAGNMLAAWRFANAGMVINRRLQGNPWSTSTSVVEGVGQELEQLKCNAAGKALMLISNRLGSAGFLQFDLAAPSPLTGTGGIPAYGSAPDGHVFPDGSMRVFVASVDANNGNSSRLVQWRFAPPFGWGGPEPVSEISSHDFIGTGLGVRNPHVAGADAAGNLLVTWEERDTASGGRGRIAARRFHAGLNAWRDVAEVAPQTSPVVDQRAPVGSITPDGSATLVFKDELGGTLKGVHFR